MTKKRGHRFDVRCVRCMLCGKLFRREDVKQGICRWCAWDRLAWWKKDHRFCSALLEHHV